MKPVLEEYPDEPGIMVEIQVCSICNFQYLPHKEECKLDRKLLYRRTEQLTQVRLELKEALRKLEQYERK
jgi:hypothetical protein